MQFQRHDWDIHIVCAAPAGTAGEVQRSQEYLGKQEQQGSQVPSTPRPAITRGTALSSGDMAGERLAGSGEPDRGGRTARRRAELLALASGDGLP